MADKNTGFDDFIAGSAGIDKKASDMGVKGKWPSASEMEAFVKKGMGGDVTHTPLQVMDPAYFDPLLFFIQHRDRKELNFRLRYYMDYDPVVGGCIDMHSSFPFSDFHLQCGDATIQRHYMDLKDRIELLPLAMYIAKDYYLLGEALMYGSWSDSEKTWNHFSLLPPEKVEFKSTYITPRPVMMLQVDNQLKTVVNSSDQVDQAITNMMDQDMVEKIRTQQYIVLPQHQISHFCSKTSQTDLRGTPILKRALKALVLKDSLRLLQKTVLERHTFPLKIFKLGNPASVEGDHRIFVRNDVTKKTETITFDEFWNRCSGHVEFDIDQTYLKEIKVLSQEYSTLQYGGRSDQKWSPIRAIIRHRSPKDMVKVITSYTSAKMTRSHGVMWINPATLHYEPVPVYVLENREKAAVVGVDSISYRCLDTHWNEFKITSDLAYTLGLWVTDGCFEGRTKNCLRLVNTEKNVVDTWIDRAQTIEYTESVKHRTPRYRDANSIGSKTAFVAVINNKVLKNSLMDFLGINFRQGKSISKTGIERLPHELLFHESDDVFGALIAGIIDGDGSISSDKHTAVIVHKTSKVLCDELVLALLARGIVSYIKTYQPKTKGAITGTLVLYRVVVTGRKDLQKLLNLVSKFMCHQGRLSELKKSVGTEQHWDNSCHFGNVYDLDSSVLKRVISTTPHDQTGPIRSGNSRLSAHVLERSSDTELKTKLQDFFCVPVKEFRHEAPTTEYVYDLSLEDDPHTYLVSGNGWSVTANTGWIPPRAHFETFRNLLMQAAGDPDFSIIFHSGLTTEFLGTKDKIENLIPHLDWCDKEIMTALFTNSSLLHAEGVSYANANVSVRILMSRYQALRSRMELMFNNKIFYQMAKARGYYIADKTGNSGRKSENINGKYMLLDLPKFRWQKLNLMDDTSQKNFIMKLRDKNEVPHKLVSEIFDLEEDDMRRQLDDEDGTIVDPVYIAARRKASTDPHIQEQVLKHVKTEKWETDKQDAAKEKKKPAPTKGPTPNLMSEIDEQPAAEDVSGGPSPTGSSGPAAPPTAPGAAPEPPTI